MKHYVYNDLVKHDLAIPKPRKAHNRRFEHHVLVELQETKRLERHEPMMSPSRFLSINYINQAKQLIKFNDRQAQGLKRTHQPLTEHMPLSQSNIAFSDQLIRDTVHNELNN